MCPVLSVLNLEMNDAVLGLEERDGEAKTHLPDFVECRHGVGSLLHGRVTVLREGPWVHRRDSREG